MLAVALSEVQAAPTLMEPVRKGRLRLGHSSVHDRPSVGSQPDYCLVERCAQKQNGASRALRTVLVDPGTARRLTEWYAENSPGLHANGVPERAWPATSNASTSSGPTSDVSLCLRNRARPAVGAQPGGGPFGWYGQAVSVGCPGSRSACEMSENSTPPDERYLPVAKWCRYSGERGCTTSE